MKISKNFKANKISNISIEFETDEEIKCLEDILVLTERGLMNFSEYSEMILEVTGRIKKELG